jgi:1-acyl-sn-glycerol-3-phosphate acyltransferase
LSAKLRGWAIIAVWAICLFLIGMPALTLYLFVRNPKVIFIPARFACRLGFLVGGVRVTVQGLERLDRVPPYVFVANHQSWLDPPALFTYLGRDLAFLVKKELYRLPILNPGLYWIDCAPVDRSNKERAIESIRLAAEKVRNGRSFIIYPEGTRTRNGDMLPFKKGAFHMAIAAGVPIVPITVNGAYEIMPRGPVRAIPGTIHITVHEPVQVTGYGSERAKELAERVWRIVHSTLRHHRSGAHQPPKVDPDEPL